jgi:hypothetical protein
MPDTNLTQPRAESGHDRDVTRPHPTLRVAILVAAVACLGLAMCARSRPTQTAPTQQAPTQAPQTPQQPGSATPQLEEGKMGKEEPERFPATKAPGRMY